MTDADTLFHAIVDDGGPNETVTINDAPDGVAVGYKRKAVTLEPDKARELADRLEKHARDAGWYEVGTTEYVCNKLREVADEVNA